MCGIITPRTSMIIPYLKAFRKEIFFIGGKKMHITKCNNGLYKVEFKGLDFPLYVEDYNQALELIFKLVGVSNAK